MMLSIPKVLLVGAGPGDPGLLTLKAARALKEAEVILYDRLVSAEVLAMANPEAEFLYAGKNDGEQERMQEWINAEMLSQALAGKRVVRLKGGDALIFGRGGEEWRFLAEHGVEVEEIPGLSSALADISRPLARLRGHNRTLRARRHGGLAALCGGGHAGHSHGRSQARGDRRGYN